MASGGFPSRLVDACRAGQFSVIIGLTGGLASGKSSAMSYLRSLGAVTVDADALAHSTYLPGGRAYEPLLAAFGRGILREDGSGQVDRAALGAKVFADKQALATLQSIVWPATAQAAVESLVSQAQAQAPQGTGVASGPRIGVLEAALLIEAGWAEACDEVWVTVPGTGPGWREEAVSRAVARSQGALSREAALARIQAQMTQEERVAHSKVTAVIDTSGPVEATRDQLQRHWNCVSQTRKPGVAQSHPETQM